MFNKEDFVSVNCNWRQLLLLLCSCCKCNPTVKWLKVLRMCEVRGEEKQEGVRSSKLHFSRCVRVKIFLFT